MDVVTLGAALNGSKKYTDQVAQSLMGGVHYRGSVSYYADLPNDASEGDSYTVKYAGTSGSVADGTEYTWGYDTDSQDYAWISFSKDSYSKAETDDAFVKKVDEYNAGKTVPQGTSVTIDGTTYTVGTGAEIFNNYTSNKATGDCSHAEGHDTKALAMGAHAEGVGTKATAMDAHAEGVSTTASGQNSHAEGAITTASGAQSHAEGSGSMATAMESHAEGAGTTASGQSSHSEGAGTIASGVSSHAEGSYTKASSNNQHVEGKYNVEDSNNKFAHIIGNGTANNARSNAFAVDWNGKIYTNNAAKGVDVCTDLQSKIDSTHKLSADLVDDSNSTNKFNVQANWTESSSAAASFIQNKPTLGTASALDVASSGDASTTEVVKGDDTRVLAVTAQQDTVANGGRGYAIINGIRLYANPSGVPPTGDIPDGSYGLF